MNSYKTMIHIRCPFQPVWDYYTVTVEMRQFMLVESFEAKCEEFRGKKLEQEKLADLLFDAILAGFALTPFKLTVAGRHGANCEVVAYREYVSPTSSDMTSEQKKSRVATMTESEDKRLPLSVSQVTDIRVFKGHEGWEIDGCNEEGNYTDVTWTIYDGEPMTRQKALEVADDFAREIGRPDLVGRPVVIFDLGVAPPSYLKSLPPYGVSPSKEQWFKLENGTVVTCDNHGDPCQFVRVLLPDGGEIAYWEYDDWAADPAIMGALFGAMMSTCATEICKDPKYYMFGADCRFPDGVVLSGDPDMKKRDPWALSDGTEAIRICTGVSEDCDRCIEDYGTPDTWDADTGCDGFISKQGCSLCGDAQQQKFWDARALRAGAEGRWDHIQLCEVCEIKVNRANGDAT